MFVYTQFCTRFFNTSTMFLNKKIERLMNRYRLCNEMLASTCVYLEENYDQIPKIHENVTQ